VHDVDHRGAGVTELVGDGDLDRVRPSFSFAAACQAIVPEKCAGKCLLTKCTRLVLLSWRVISRTPFDGLIAETEIRRAPL